MSILLEEFIDQLSSAYAAFTDDDDAEPSHCFCLVLDHWERVSAHHGYSGLLVLLNKFLARIEEHLETNISMARLDERSVVGLLPPSADKPAEQQLNRLFNAVSGSKFEVSGESMAVSITLAWAEFDHRFTKADNLLLSLTRSAKNATSTGGNCVMQIQPEVSAEEATSDNRQMLALLLDSLRKDAVKVMFQPLMATAGESMQTFQALPRLLATDHSLIPAAKFVPAARDAGILATLDRWMLSHCIKLLSNDYKEIPIRLFLAQGDDLIQLPERRQWLENLAKQHPAIAGKLTLDFPLPDMLSHIVGSQELFGLLERIGVDVCVSNVDERSRWDLLVNEIPAKFIKMSPSFVRRLTHEEMLEGEFMRVCKPARDRGAKLVMPMVEDAAVASNLWKVGADYMQGFMIQEAQEQIELSD
jgi:EAL domain-containing protein (putative c-di-GMP-specific phosphodiesterase class I)/GGDEF domain-containing protein